MAHHKRIKLMQQMLEQTGLEFIRFESRQPHLITAVARSPDGQHTRMFSITVSEGDPRGDKNELARMRQFARENPRTVMAEALKPVIQEFKHVPISVPAPAAAADTDESLADRIFQEATGGSPDAGRESAVEQGQPPAVADAQEGNEQTGGVQRIEKSSAASHRAAPKRVVKYARLSMTESIKLSHWLAKQEKMPYRIEDLIKEVRVQLEMNVTATSLTSIMEATGVKLAEKPAKRKYQFYSPLLAQEIMRIQRELGMKINPDLAALAKEKVR